jgi:hypothetical protein
LIVFFPTDNVVAIYIHLFRNLFEEVVPSLLEHGLTIMRGRETVQAFVHVARYGQHPKHEALHREAKIAPHRGELQHWVNIT